MRIVATGDTHGRHDELPIPDGDVFVFVGDACWDGDIKEFQEFESWLQGLDFDHKIVIAGNHDLPLEQADDPHGMFEDAIYLEDESVEIDGIKFYGTPWSPEFQHWSFMLPRGKALRQKWTQIPQDTDVLLTHCPPQGMMDLAPGEKSHQLDRAGSGTLRYRIQMQLDVRLHLFGHIHECGGVKKIDEMMYSNVSMPNTSLVPYQFDIDDEGIANYSAPETDNYHEELQI